MPRPCGVHPGDGGGLPLQHQGTGNHGGDRQADTWTDRQTPRQQLVETDRQTPGQQLADTWTATGGDRQADTWTATGYLGK